MLLNRDTAEGLANGSITLVLRRWDVPRARPGGKQRVRQLKGLGLTISLDVGYRISPRGREYLTRQGTIER